MTNKTLGAPLKAREAPRMLRGEAKYTADITLPGMLYMEILRSEHGHAIIRGIDTTAAQSMPGVVRVVTSDDINDKIMPMPCVWVPGGVESHFPPHPSGLPGAGTVLATGKVRYIGEPVAVVVAETRAQAADAVRAIRVDYEVLPAVVTPEAALADGAPQLHEAVPKNLNARWTCGDEEAANRAIETAEVTVEIELYNQRTINCPIEPRAAVGAYDPQTEEYTLWATTQNPHNHRFLLAALVLGVPFNKVRVIAPESGGSFGTKGYLYPDMPLVLFLAKALGRPVKWVDSRNGLMRSTVQGRDQKQYATLAGTRDGNITGLRATAYANLGAYPSTVGPGVVTAMMGRSITSAYDIPNPFCEVWVAFTNTVVLGAQRGSGRSEAVFLIERLIDLYAAKIGMDPAEVRRRNLIQASQQPFDNRLGWIYDSGDYPAAFERALELAGYADMPERKREARTRGKRLGVGLTCFTALCGVGPSGRTAKEGLIGGAWESANLRVHPTGEATLTIGAASTGQSHETVFAQIVAEEFGVDPDTIEVVHSDTQKAPYGQGTYGSRSWSIGGPAVQLAARDVVAKMRAFAAHGFGVPVDQVTVRDGRFFVEGDPEKSKTFQDLARDVWFGWDYPLGMEPALDITRVYDPPDFNFPYAAAVAVVEVDERTGEVDLVHYAAVHDVGPAGNALVLDGQIEGGVAHGMGQALMEEARYDSTGRLLTDSMDRYAIPKAEDLAGRFTLERTETPTPHSALGGKGAGEIGSIAPAAAITNAVCDALSDLGVRHLDMPLTPEKVWRAMQNGNGKGGQ
jgi:carbon-monoxide dehydrogenase large subunit